jgi:hypothetical protein
MISDTNSDSKLYENGSLLDDLISYVYSGNQLQMILLGMILSASGEFRHQSTLDIQTLGMNYVRSRTYIELDEVMRQEENSGILHNATELPGIIKISLSMNSNLIMKFKDIVRLTDGYDIQDAINSAYSNYSIEDTFIVRSNKRANQYNEQIRTKILDKESELSTGDFLMVVKNNYFWLKDSDEAGLPMVISSKY